MSSGKVTRDHLGRYESEQCTQGMDNLGTVSREGTGEKCALYTSSNSKATGRTYLILDEVLEGFCENT